MGLLEKAQERVLTGKNLSTKQIEKESKAKGLLEKAKQKKENVKNQELKQTEKLTEQTKKPKGLLEKAKLKKEINTEEKKLDLDIKTELDKNKDIIEEKKGFGWNGTGTRRIVFDHNINEHIYEVLEPVLTKEEIEVKEELTRLFKMLADVNISDMDKKDKKRYLEETLEQIIIDNDIKFYGRKKKKEEKDKKAELEKKHENKKKKSLKNLFSKNKKEEKVELLIEINKQQSGENKKKNPIKNLFSKKNKKEKFERKIESENEKQNILKKKEKAELEKKHENKKKKSLKNLFSKNKKEEKTDIQKSGENKKKNPIKNLFSKKNKDDKDKLTKERIAELEEISKKKIFYHLFKEFIGYGKIDIIMEDEGIEDISCDGFEVPVFIYHKKYDEISTNVKFDNEFELDSFVIRLAQICGKQISIYSPIVDGKLPDGSRLQTTLAKTVTKPSTFTIRKFKENPLTPVDLIGFRSMSLDMAAYFWFAIENGASILFCGGTASGKTTALNALSLFIPSSHKIVSIEDTREVSLPHSNWIAGTTRQGFSASDEKTGKDIDMFDLIRAALRQRPKVIIVGEVRGKEAYSLFQAMATGHTSYATVHASDIHTLIQRLENPPISLPRALLTSLDIIAFQNAIDISGKTVRRMTSVTEIVKLDPDTNQLIFMEPFKWVSKTDDRFDSGGASKILNNIRLQNDWTEEQLQQEIKNRIFILNWMSKKNIKDYREVGKIVSEYGKNPEKLLKRAKVELNK
jgi:flagellar protein FlaI